MPFLNATGADKTVPLWIGGKAALSESKATFPIIHSSTGATVHKAVSAGVAEAHLACETSAEAFKTWRKTTPTYRRAILNEVAEIYERRVEEIANLMVAETNCQLAFAKFNVKLAIENILEIAAATSELRGIIPQRPTGPNGLEADGINVMITEPVGTLLIIPPWNSAVILGTRAITMAIAAGCCVVVKASEKCPATYGLLLEMFEEAGVPAGVMNMIQAARQDAAAVTEALIAHPAIRKVDFIGSQAIGRVIGSLCGQYLKPILMELGGKGPAIVLDDANLELAANLCAVGATIHHGQICFSTERVIVQRSVAEKFIPLLKKEFEALHTAGFAVDDAGAKHAYEVLQDAQENGVTFLVGGPTYLDKNSLKPTLVTDVTPKARIWDEESFGSSTSVYIVDTDEEAVARANDSAYGLSAAVHSKSWERAFSLAKNLEYGQVWINQMTVNDAVTQPVRGVKGSGWNASNSIWGIREFTIEKCICLGPSTGSAAPFASTTASAS